MPICAASRTCRRATPTSERGLCALTPFAAARYSAFVCAGGELIPEPTGHEFKQLEEAVAALVDRHRRAQHEISTLRRELAEREQRLRTQDDELRRLNQRRQDATRRLDQLVAELDRLDAQIASRAVPRA